MSLAIFRYLKLAFKKVRLNFDKITGYGGNCEYQENNFNKLKKIKQTRRNFQKIKQLFDKIAIFGGKVTK